MQKITHIGPMVRMIHTAIDRQINTRVQEMELTSAQIFVLHYINRNSDKDVFQKDIEKHFELSHATVSGLISRLEAKGFIECLPAKNDKRYKRLCVTEKARCYDEQMRQHIDQVEKQALEGFSDEDIRQLQSYLDRILANLGIDLAEEKNKRGKEND